MRLSAPDFSLQHTVSSGQLFRYEEVAEGYLIAHRDKAFVVSHEGDELIIHAHTANVTAVWLAEFFALDERPPEPVDAYSAQAIAYCGGMRICRQDAWECTVGFLCSQNNNIARIRQLMTGLAKAFGTKVQVGTYEAYLFPEPGTFRASAALRSIRSGYRERYLLAASAMLTDDWLASLGELSYPEAKRWIMTLPGIGPKVADCILLFAFGHRGAFPIDTWVDQFMREQYRVRTKRTQALKAQKLFGKDAGIMQQYLFHYRRNH